MEEIRRKIDLVVPMGTLRKAVRDLRLSFKRTTFRAAEQDRLDVLKKREEWKAMQAALDRSMHVIVDETCAKTNMARTRGRAPRG